MLGSITALQTLDRAALKRSGCKVGKLAIIACGGDNTTFSSAVTAF